MSRSIAARPLSGRIAAPALTALAAALMLSLVLSQPVPTTWGPEPAIPPVDQPPVAANLPLQFVANQGQSDPQVSYYLQGAGSSVWFTTAGVTMALPGKDGAAPWVLKLDFAGANPVEPEPIGEVQSRVGYFTGAQESWRSGIPAFSGIAYRDLWPGIDLEYAGTGGRLKYQFVVAPGADPSQIRLAYRGAGGLAVTPGGQLQVDAPNGGLTDDKPYTYQQTGGRRVEVASSYAVGAAVDGAHPYGFTVGQYDPALPLVIDPAILVYAGYIGGTAFDHGLGIDVDAAGAAYVAGETASTQTSFPASAGFDSTYNGGGDAYLAKVKPDGTSLQWAAYLGGTDFDQAFDVEVDASGAAYLAGHTISTNFPAAGGLDSSYNGGAHDAFVTKISADGATILWSGYIGGAGDDRATGVAVDSSGSAHLSGMTSSAQATFPVTGGPDLTYGGGAYDAFVAKVKADGSGFDYLGYVGGAADDQGYSVAVDGAGAAYLGGQTSSTEANFPVAVGPDTTSNGSYDGFVAKVNPGGGGLAYAGYLGGPALDGVFGIAVDSLGAAYVTGASLGGFPIVGPLDGSYGGGVFDGFVAKVNPAGTTLDYSGYIGGSGYDVAWGIAVDGSGAAHVTGETGSNQTSFPVTSGPDSTYNGASVDAFVTKVNPAGSAFVYSGYIGGSAYDQGLAIALDAAGSAYLVGETASNQATFPELVGPDLGYNGGSADAFVAKVGLANLDLTIVKSCTPKPVRWGDTLTCSLTVTNTGSQAASNLSITDDLAPNLTLAGTPTGADCAVQAVEPEISCTRASLDPGSFTVTYSAVLSEETPPGFAYNATATVTTTDLETSTANNSATATIAVPACTQTGSAGNDTLSGTFAADVICGLGGDDTLRGFGSGDILVGGAGNDNLTGNPGNDLLVGNEGNDTLNGSENDDRLLGGPGDDQMFGEAGNDTLSGGDGTDTANGGDGTDICTAENQVSC